MSRALKWGTLALTLLASPGAVRAAIVIGGGGLGPPYQFVQTRDSTGTASQEDNPASFPASNLLSAGAKSLATDLYSYIQSGDFTHLIWSVTENQDGGPGSFALSSAYVPFTPTVDETFTWTANWNGLGTAGSPFYVAQFHDDATGFLFNDAAPTNHAGKLIAGHHYYIYEANYVSEGPTSGLGPTAASGEFDLICGTPEPASLAVWSLIAGIFGVDAMRKRLQRTVDRLDIVKSPCPRDGQPVGVST